MRDERTVLVTGGGGGLGRAVGARLLGAGCRVALLGRRAEPVEAAAAALGERTLAVTADVADRAAVEAALDAIARRWERPTWIVHAAGVAAGAPTLPPDDDLWARTLAVNATGAWHVATAAAPAMVDAGGGAIVFVASTAALRGFRFTAAYVASKHAVLGLTRALAEDLAGKAVRVNAVCPGFLDTPMTGRSIDRIVERTGRSAEQARASLAAMNARGELVPPQEVAEAIHALLDDPERTGDAVVIE